MVEFTHALQREGESQEARLRERDEEIDGSKSMTAEIIAAHAKKNEWDGVDELYAALEIEPPNPRVEFDMTLTVRVLATRVGGDPGDELSEAFIANSFSTGIVHGDSAEGFGVWADADLKDVEIVAGSSRFDVKDIERMEK
jgi:hypothetical protein